MQTRFARNLISVPKTLVLMLVLGVLLTVPVSVLAAAPQRLTLEPNDEIVIIGNTLAERMSDYGYWETLLHTRFPKHHLVVRNLGWSADELTLRPRSKDFKDHGHTLENHPADVVIACFGFNESFAGPKGLSKFENDLRAFIKQTTSTSYNGQHPPQLVLLSPIAHENLHRRTLPDGSQNNKNLQLYTDAMLKVAADSGVLAIDLFRPSLALMEKAERPLTINGVHLNEAGYQAIAPIMDAGLFGPQKDSTSQVDLAKLREAVLEKNLQFWYDHRAVNGYYIYGGRKAPFGIINFPVEFAKLRKMIKNRDQRIWDIAEGKTVSTVIDDSNTGPLPEIESNVNKPVSVTAPEETAKAFTLPEGYEANLFASEGDFPDLENPVQMAFDAKGRLWVCTMPSYPMYTPGKPVDDKILILEDTDADGRADKQTIFARGLHIPTGLEIGDGGAYVAQQPNLVFLKDEDGDDHADSKEIRLHGFDSADSHHSLSAFT